MVSFGCDLSALSPSGLAFERWDDVPAVSDGYEAARDAMLERIGRLLDELGHGDDQEPTYLSGDVPVRLIPSAPLFRAM